VGRLLIGAGITLLLAAPACGPGNGAPGGPTRLAMMVAASEREAWAPIGESFETEHPGVRVDLVEGPNATDLRENLYTAALLAGDDAFDLVSMDVTWMPKFAAAGWLAPLDEAFTAAQTDALLPEDLAAGRFAGRLYRVPVRTDVGLLYYRRDLLEHAHLAPPETFDDLVRIARRLQSPPDLWGYVWQGAQYEGLVCNYLEVLQGRGGFWIQTPTLELGLGRPAALDALDFLRACRMGAEPISPPGVTTYKEEESRRLFQDGRAVFLRSWPYVWRLAQAPGSRIAGKIGALALVHAPGREAGGTLGGWGLGVSRFSRHPALAIEFIRHAVAPASQQALCRDTGYAPALIAAYGDPVLLAGDPFLGTLRRLHRGAILRPAVPRYAQASDILQRHLSAALSGLEQPSEALAAAERETRLLLGPERSASGAPAGRRAS
jgi:multiple sugar transport system substrate-binding protein